MEQSDWDSAGGERGAGGEGEEPEDLFGRWDAGSTRSSGVERQLRTRERQLMPRRSSRSTRACVSKARK